MLLGLLPYNTDTRIATVIKLTMLKALTTLTALRVINVTRSVTRVIKP